MEVSCGKQEKSGNDATRDKARANSGRGDRATRRHGLPVT